MKVKKSFIAVVLSVSLSVFVLPHILSISASAQAQDPKVAVQHGFRAGYSDGYMAGYRDTIDSLSKDLSRHADYIKADRAYSKEYGGLQDYRDGYQQGFESGYDTGFERRSFESTLPADLKRRGGVETATQTKPDPPAESQTAVGTDKQVNPAAENTVAQTTTEPAGELKPVTDEPVKAEPPPAVVPETAEPGKAEPPPAIKPATEEIPAKPEPAPAVNDDANVASSSQATNDAVIVIPRDTELILELQSDLNTQQTREGERFTAKVASPAEIAGATIEGRVTKVRQPGRISRRSELLLSFDRIVLSDNRWSNFSGILVDVMPVKGDNVSKVDTEGTAIGQSTFKQDAIKVGGATGAGLVIGAVTGGPVGAAVGAGVGAAFGVGAVVIDRGKHVRLNRNQQLRVKAAYETRIR